MIGTNGNNKVLIVDSDDQHCATLGDSLARHEFQVFVSHSTKEALRVAVDEAVGHAIVELQAPGHEGLKLVEQIRASNGDAKIVMLATHPSIATAVAAIQRGATHYLPKPVRPEEVIAVFERRSGDDTIAVDARPLSLEAFIWEYIDRVLVETGGNVSAAARTLDMHRRTLQRKLRQRNHGAKRGLNSGRLHGEAATLVTGV